MVSARSTMCSTPPRPPTPVWRSSTQCGRTIDFVSRTTRPTDRQRHSSASAHRYRSRRSPRSPSNSAATATPSGTVSVLMPPAIQRSALCGSPPNSPSKEPASERATSSSPAVSPRPLTSSKATPSTRSTTEPRPFLYAVDAGSLPVTSQHLAHGLALGELVDELVQIADFPHQGVLHVLDTH